MRRGIKPETRKVTDFYCGWLIQTTAARRPLKGSVENNFLPDLVHICASLHLWMPSSIYKTTLSLRKSHHVGEETVFCFIFSPLWVTLSLMLSQVVSSASWVFFSQRYFVIVWHRFPLCVIVFQWELAAVGKGDWKSDTSKHRMANLGRDPNPLSWWGCLKLHFLVFSLKVLESRRSLFSQHSIKKTFLQFTIRCSLFSPKQPSRKNAAFLRQRG